MKYREYKALLEMVDYIISYFYYPEPHEIQSFKYLYSLGLEGIGKIYRLSKHKTRKIAKFAYDYCLRYS